MATISENLIAINNVKNNLKTKLEEKGVDMADIPFTDYPNKLDEIASEIGGDGETVLSDNICSTNILQDWEDGHYGLNGNKGNYANRIRLKNLLKVDPNSVYLLNTDKNGINFIIREMDANSSFVKDDGTKTNNTYIITEPETEYLAVSLYGITGNIQDYSDAYANGEFSIIIRKVECSGGGSSSGGGDEYIDPTASFIGLQYIMQRLTKEVPLINLGSYTSAQAMFYNCENIETIPLLNTSNIKNMNGIFYNCIKLKTIPLLDTSSVTNMSAAFAYCESLESVPSLNFSNVTNMDSTFAYCEGLQTIPKIDTSKVVNINGAFVDCLELVNVGGFQNLGSSYTVGAASNYENYKLALGRSTKMSHDSLINIINNLYDIASKGCNPQTLNIGATNLAKLTDEEIAIATNKGWTVS